MSGELLHIRNHHGFFPVHASPAYTLVVLELLAGYRTLVRSNHQPAFLQEIIPCPEKVVHLMMQHGNDGGHTGQLIVACGQQFLKLFVYAVVAVLFLFLIHGCLYFYWVPTIAWG